MKPTNWIVITGAPCSGKSTVIRALEGMGYPVVHETARLYLEQKLARGFPAGAVKADRLAFQQRILQRKIAVEQRLHPETLVFLDRAVPDSIAYFKDSKLDVQAPMLASRGFRYRKILLFDRLPFRGDAVRVEDEMRAVRLEGLLVAGYRLLGYPLVRVPVLELAERVRFVLERAEES